MSYTCFDVEIKDKVAWITLNRPEKRNSMILRFWDELPACVGDIDSESRARVIVIASTGPHFSAGLDVKEFFEAEENDERDARTRKISHGAEFYQKVGKMQATFTALENCRIPVIAAIQGGCIGGAVDLITACDMRYATDDSYFCVAEINIGMTADVGTFPRLLNLIPEGVVREMCYTGMRMPADRAKRAGLVNAIYADQKSMLDDVSRTATEIAQKAPLALYGCKRMINYSRDHSTQDTLDYVRLWNASMLQPDEIMEAISAKAEKRAGKFVELPKIKAKVE